MPEPDSCICISVALLVGVESVSDVTTLVALELALRRPIMRQASWVRIGIKLRPTLVARAEYES